MSSRSADVLIVGAGIIGSAIALEWKSRFPSERVVVLDKEDSGLRHSSGRNSGVVHAGFYYAPGSLKARMTAEGNRLLSEFCKAHGLPLLACGKLVVARNEAEDKSLDVLAERGRLNGAHVELLDLQQAREIEPRVRTHRRALWSPRTKVGDPGAVLNKIQHLARALGVEFYFDRAFWGAHQGSIDLPTGPLSYGYLVNAAGLHADRIAHAQGFGRAYKILPFKGVYLKSSVDAPAFRTNIYPVPDLGYPFLGVHVTMTLDGRSKLGPTAIPAFWREQYRALDGFRWSEFLSIGPRHLWFLLRNDRVFMKMAVEELRKYNRRFMVEKASAMAEGIVPAQYPKWGAPGIRAQLVHVESAKLEMDFVIEGDGRSLHVLNSVSPGWTCSFPFAKLVCDQIEKRNSVSGGEFSLKESEL